MKYLEQRLFHIRNFTTGFSLFPREVGIKIMKNGEKIFVRRKVNNEKEYFEFIEKNKVDVYVGLFSIEQQMKNIYDAVYLDVDEPEYLEKVLERIKKYKYSLWFSGRGYHIYLLFKPVVINNFGLSVELLLEKLGIKKYLDFTISKDRRRLVRIPYTINSKTGKQMEFIGLHNGDNETIGKFLSSISGAPQNGYIEPDAYLDIKIIPPCIFRLLNFLAEVGSLEHVERFFLGTFLIRYGLNKEELHRVYKLAHKYDYIETERQIQSLYKYRLYNCQTVKDLGICPTKCPYYPSLNRFLK